MEGALAPSRSLIMAKALTIQIKSPRSSKRRVRVPQIAIRSHLFTVRARRARVGGGWG